MFDFYSFIFGLVLGGILIGLYMTLPIFHEESPKIKMSNIVIRKVKVLQGIEKVMAEKQGLSPDDLVILTVAIERIVGAPVSYLLKDLHSSEQSTKVNESE